MGRFFKSRFFVVTVIVALILVIVPSDEYIMALTEKGVVRGTGNSRFQKWINGLTTDKRRIKNV